MKKIIIIGATSGIGRELAKNYAAEGYLVGATGRKMDLLQSLQQEFPEQVIVECFDVTGNDNISHLKNLLQQMGGADAFIYNSGYGDTSKTLDWSIDRQTTLTNVNGFVELTNFMFNYFAGKGNGQIAGISSIASIRGNSWSPAYSASKAFMSNYLEGVRIKAGRMKLNLSVTDIQPGFVQTKMAEGHKRFWECPVKKAAKQIVNAIHAKKRRAYIIKRWWLIAKLLPLLPNAVIKRLL